MEIDKGEGGHVKRLEKSFKNANFEQDIICMLWQLFYIGRHWI